MKIGLWFLPAGAIGAVGTILAASLPVPPSLPHSWAGVEPAKATSVAAAIATPATPLVSALPPPASLSRPAVALPRVSAATALPRPKRNTTAAAALRSADPRNLTRGPALWTPRRSASAAPVHHYRATAHAVGPRYRVIVRGPRGPYPRMYGRGPTQIAMGPPPYGMPPPYWGMPYAPR